MEFIYTHDMTTSYQELLKAQKKTVVKRWIYISSFMVVPTIFFFLFYDMGLLYRIIFFSSISLFILFWMITLFVTLFHVSEKPYYESFYPQVINDINNNEPILFLYQPYPPEKSFFNSSNLYPLLSAKHVKMRMSFVSKHNFGIDVYDAIVNNTGLKRVNYLNGYYFIIKGYSAPHFQIRTYYNPFGRTKYKRLIDVSIARAFVAPDQFDVDGDYLRLYNLIKDAFDSPSVSMSSTGEDLHIGITLHPMKRKIKKLDEACYNKLRLMLMQIVDIANLIKPISKK